MTTPATAWSETGTHATTFSSPISVWTACRRTDPRGMPACGTYSGCSNLEARPLVLALLECERIASRRSGSPGVNIIRADFASGLGECGADAEWMEIAECDLPSHAAQGYEGILIASGRTMPGSATSRTPVRSRQVSA